MFLITNIYCRVCLCSINPESCNSSLKSVVVILTVCHCVLESGAKIANGVALLMHCHAVFDDQNRANACMDDVLSRALYLLPPPLSLSRPLPPPLSLSLLPSPSSLFSHPFTEYILWPLFLSVYLCVSFSHSLSLSLSLSLSISPCLSPTQISFLCITLF